MVVHVLRDHGFRVLSNIDDFLRCENHHGIYKGNDRDKAVVSLVVCMEDSHTCGTAGQFTPIHTHVLNLLRVVNYRYSSYQVILIFNLVEFKALAFGPYVLPNWAQGIGWAMALSAPGVVVLFAIINTVRSYFQPQYNGLSLGRVSIVLSKFDSILHGLSIEHVCSYRGFSLWRNRMRIGSHLTWEKMSQAAHQKHRQTTRRNHRMAQCLPIQVLKMMNHQTRNFELCAEGFTSERELPQRAALEEWLLTVYLLVSLTSNLCSSSPDFAKAKCDLNGHSELWSLLILLCFEILETHYRAKFHIFHQFLHVISSCAMTAWFLQF